MDLILLIFCAVVESFVKLSEKSHDAVITVEASRDRKSHGATHISIQLV